MPSISGKRRHFSGHRRITKKPTDFHRRAWNGARKESIRKDYVSNHALIKVGLRTPDLHQRLQIALANVPVFSEQVEASYLGTPVLDRRRLKALTSLLNAIS